MLALELYANTTLCFNSNLQQRRIKTSSEEPGFVTAANMLPNQLHPQPYLDEYSCAHSYQKHVAQIRSKGSMCKVTLYMSTPQLQQARARFVASIWLKCDPSHHFVFLSSLSKNFTYRNAVFFKTLLPQRASHSTGTSLSNLIHLPRLQNHLRQRQITLCSPPCLLLIPFLPPQCHYQADDLNP